MRKLQNDLDNLSTNKVDLKEYQCFKKFVINTQQNMKNEIEEYILRDPEAAGIIQYVKYYKYHTMFQ